MGVDVAPLAAQYRAEVSADFARTYEDNLHLPRVCTWQGLSIKRKITLWQKLAHLHPCRGKKFDYSGAGGRNITMERFRISVGDERLADLSRRLEKTRWPDLPGASGWEAGTDPVFLKELVAYWRNGYDWRKEEAELNRLSHYRCRMDGMLVHFVHERGRGPSPMPILLTHGWPDSFLRYKKIIPLLTDPASHGGDARDSFDVVVPSVPGFGFSTLPEQGCVNNRTIAGLWARLMTEKLGYARFAAAGGDVGSGVTRYLAAAHPELLHGIHLTDIGILRDLLNAPEGSVLTGEERQYAKSARTWIASEGGYMALQSTKPQTLAFALNDSPAGLAAWIVEKFRSWSDCGGDVLHRFSRDELLTNVMLYWITGTAASSARLYYENLQGLPPPGFIDVPTAVALFAGDILPPPKTRAERVCRLARWTQLPRGGHFAAMEEPELLAEDIRAFFRPLRGK